MMHGSGWGHMGSWGWLGMLMMLVFWFSAIWLIVWVISGFRRPRSAGDEQRTSSRDQSMVILRERLARGEITADEFEQTRHILEQSSSHPSS